MAAQVYAIAGHGDIHPDNVKALLNDQFCVDGEDDDGYPIWNEKVGEPVLYYVFDDVVGGGFKAAFDYTDYADLDLYPLVDEEIASEPSVKEAISVTDNEPELVNEQDIPRAVVRYLVNRGTLIVLGTEYRELIIEALGQGVTVLDLCSGLDSVSLEDLETASDEPVNDSAQTDEEITEAPQGPTQGQDEAQTEAPDHLRVDHTTEGGLRPGVSVPTGPSPVPYTNAETLLWQFSTLIAPYVAEEIKRQNLLAPEAPISQPVGVAAPTKTRGRPRKA